MDLESQVVIHTELERRRQLFVLLTIIITHLTYYYELLFLSRRERILYHTSILTGEGWMLELLNGHPD
ncbi:hypothetical protein OG21DRAFT_1407786 [Imleria badia]|nr:hypothetical protein OG21DRAFT_1407786 [Imleria badia]